MPTYSRVHLCVSAERKKISQKNVAKRSKEKRGILASLNNLMSVQHLPLTLLIFRPHNNERIDNHCPPTVPLREGSDFCAV